MLFRKKMLAAAGLTAMIVAAPVSAATVTVGDAHPTTANDCTPFCTPVIQTAYGASYFGSAPVSISSVGLYLKTGTNQNFTFTLSTSANIVGNLSTTFANNLSGDAQTFFSGALPSVMDADGFTIFSGTPFTYDPTKGDLLLQITSDVSSFAGSSGYQGEERGINSAPVERVYSFNPGAQAGIKETPGYSFDTKFSVSALDLASGAPEPAAWLMMIAGFGLVGYTMRNAKRRSDDRFDARIRRIAGGAMA